MNSLEGIYLSGEIGKRAGRNQERFFQPDFWPDQEKAFRNPDYEWPGDNEGRLLLAHILLERCTHRTSRELPVILDKILRKMNSQGYYGPVIGDGFISEQQAAGNSWILRGLTEYYLWKKEQTVLEAIKRLVHGYLYELEKNMDTYPMGPEVMNYKGEAEGCLIPEPFGKWYMSTDFGCLFILLDGATAALEILQDSRLENFVRKLIGKFGQLDPEKYHLQTHATLSAARGILRYYEFSGEKEYLSMARHYFELYVERGMDAVYANYNWFGVPEFTEPCAIVDSYILAVSLYRSTNDAGYLNTAHYVMYNGLLRGQRPEGGFGCDTCVTEERPITQIVEENYEAWWCCSKRGAEFFSVFAGNLIYSKEEAVLLPFYEDMTASVSVKGGKAVLRESTMFPRKGYICLEVVQREQEGMLEVGFFIPEYVDPGTICLKQNGKTGEYRMENNFLFANLLLKPGEKLELEFDMPLRLEKAPGRYSGEESKVVMYGPQILAAVTGEDQDDTAAEDLMPAGNGWFRNTHNGSLWIPVGEFTYADKENAISRRARVIFKQRI